jgi:hypothetical protein
MLLLLLLSYSIPLDSPYMGYIEYLQVKGYIDIPSVQPYDIEWLVPELGNLLLEDVRLRAIDRCVVSYIAPLVSKNEDISYLLHLNGTYESKPEYYYGFLDCAAGGAVAEGIRFACDLRFQRGSEIDVFGPEPWNDFQVYLNEGLLKFTTNKLHAEIGRRNLVLGYTNRFDLLLSPDPEGYDGYFLSIAGKYYELYTLFTIIDAAEQRYLAQHRLGLNLKGFLKLGFTEAILWGNTLEPVYLNFFFPYYLSQWGIERDDNIVWRIDGQIRVFNLLAYADVLIDDYQYENDPGRPYPHKLAFTIGTKVFFADDFLFKAYYTRVNKWVYTQRYAINVWHKNNRPLGYPLGNDADELRASITYFSLYDIHPFISVSHIRKGEGSIFLPYEEEGGTVHPPFPSGVVEKRIEFSAGVNYAVLQHLHARGAVGMRRIDNYEHTAGDNKSDTFVEVGVWGIL